MSEALVIPPEASAPSDRQCRAVSEAVRSSTDGRMTPQGPPAELLMVVLRQEQPAFPV